MDRKAPQRDDSGKLGSPPRFRLGNRADHAWFAHFPGFSALESAESASQPKGPGSPAWDIQGRARVQIRPGPDYFLKSFPWERT